MKILFYFALLLTLTSCCSESDFEFTPKHRTLLNNYKRLDTIYYKSLQNDLDTICIVAIDSFQECGALMVGKRKNIKIEIQNLPENKWTGGTELSQNGKVKVLNQELIIIEKMINNNLEDQYFIGINYRDFKGEIKNINEMISDSLLIDIGITKYWSVLNDVSDWKQFENDSTIITKIIWTEKYGLTSYYKRNGDYYKIVRN